MPRLGGEGIRAMILLRPGIGLLAALFAVSAWLPAYAEDAPKAAAPAAAQENFGEEVILPARTLLYRTKKTSWDRAWADIAGAFKALHADAGRLKLKVTGHPLVIYRSTADDGFTFDAALPVEAAPREAPGGDLHIGPSRTGKAIRFSYHGAFDAMDSTYELIANYIDSEKLDTEDLSIEEYVSDPAMAKPSDITLNIYMPLKKK
jgi:effector-binding domain-containing protein